jgi:hypothetical protein
LGKLVIIANQFFLTDFLLAQVSDDLDVEIIRHPSRQRGAHRSILKFVEAYAFSSSTRSWFFDSTYVQKLRAISEGDSVLIFGIENIKELKIVMRFVCAKRVSFFTWNPVLDYSQSPHFRRLHIKYLKKFPAKIYTFDSNDAREYGLILTNQVYRNVDDYFLNDGIQNIDLYFVGQDKGRLSVLMDLREKARRLGLNSHFHVVKDRRANYSIGDESLLFSCGIDYAENIRLIHRSKCLVDIVQKNQSGLTVRALEAIFFGKKLISNNTCIIDSKIYHPSRIFVLGCDDIERLAEFIDQPMVDVESDVLRLFDFIFWCRQFV